MAIFAAGKKLVRESSAASQPWGVAVGTEMLLSHVSPCPRQGSSKVEKNHSKVLFF